MKNKFLLLIGTIVFMLMCCYISVSAGTYTASSDSSLKTAMANAEKESSTTIYISDTFHTSNQIQIKSGMNVSFIRTGGVYLKRSGTLKTSAPLFYVYEGGTLTLKSQSGTFTISGKDIDASASLIYSAGGTVNIGSNVVIQECNNSGSAGAAIRMHGGTLNMNGGTITGNSNTKTGGGAISIENGAVANLNSGTICNNTTNGNGGGIYCLGGTLNLGNVTFSGNSAIKGNGIYVADSTANNSSVTLKNAPKISDTFYTKISFNIDSSFNSDTLITLDLPNYNIGRVIAACDTDSSTYINKFTFIGANYCLRPSADNKELCLTREYTVTFKDYDTSILKTDKVYDGESSVPPENPMREGYKFVGWDQTFDEVYDDMIVNAIYEKLNTIKVYIDDILCNTDSYDADAQLHNISAEAYSGGAVLILAKYKDNKLLDVTLADESLDDRYSVGLITTFDADTYYKAILLKSFLTCMPLSEAVTIQIQGE